MVSFSINSEVIPSIAAILWHYVCKNVGMIRAQVSQNVQGHIDKRSGVIAGQVDLLKSEIWFKTINNFRVSSANPNFEFNEQVEHYVKSTIKNTLRDINESRHKHSVPVDLDLLDGHNSSDDDIVDSKLRYQVFHTVSNSKEYESKLEHNMVLKEFRELIAEIFLTDKKLFDSLDVELQRCSDSEYYKPKINGNVKYARTKLDDKDLHNLMVRFGHYIKLLSTPDVDSVFSEFRKISPLSDINKSKELFIKEYPFYAYSEPNSIYSGVLQQGEKLSKFDTLHCKMIGSIDLQVSSCKLLNPRTKRVYRIRIEDYLDYVSYNTNVEEHVNTELIHWLKEFYMFTLPSGKQVGFKYDPSEYMRLVKQELLSNLLKANITNIFAMTDSYVYFSPKIKPKYSCINGRLFNGKVIQMQIQEVNNVYT